MQLELCFLPSRRMTQPLRMPDVEAQRAAMKQLSFLIGRWAGEARILRGPGETVELNQQEEAQYKLDGLILTIEGIGCSKGDGKTALQALAFVAYDDQPGRYIMRAFNDGRYLETELKLAEDGHGIMWGFALGEIKTSSMLRINEGGDWTEMTEITIGPQPPRKFMELRVSRQK